MSGNYGWGGNSPDTDYNTSYNRGYSRAQDAYRSQTTPSYTAPASQAVAPMKPVTRVIVPLSPVHVDLSPKVLKSEAAAVLVVAMDVTGSLSTWTKELFNRLPLLYQDLGDDIEILFIAFGDVKYRDPIQVSRFGRGQVLETYLNAFDKNMTGGGNEVESAEVVAYYLDKYVDTSSARNCYTYFVTDEGILPTVSPNLTNEVCGHLGTMTETVPTKSVMDRLLLKGFVFGVLANTNSYGAYTYENSFKPQWTDVLSSPERLLLLDDSRRLVDVMLGVVAKVTNQYAKFTQDLASRQGGTQFGQVNIQNVHKTLALVGGSRVLSPQLPAVGGTRSLI